MCSEPSHHDGNRRAGERVGCGGHSAMRWYVAVTCPGSGHQLQRGLLVLFAELVENLGLTVTTFRQTPPIAEISAVEAFVAQQQPDMIVFDIAPPYRRKLAGVCAGPCPLCHYSAGGHHHQCHRSATVCAGPAHSGKALPCRGVSRRVEAGPRPAVARGAMRHGRQDRWRGQPVVARAVVTNPGHRQSQRVWPAGRRLQRTTETVNIRCRAHQHHRDLAGSRMPLLGSLAKLTAVHHRHHQV